MSMSLAVKYRPSNFLDVCSQQSIIKILKRQIDLKQFKNAYLFSGNSGCGKTTVARIFANEINNYTGLPIEIDGASNNGVDNVRAIISSSYERSLDSKYKIFIIDECHALSSQAWQAFLKCIEEPPEYTIFLFCTTDPQKIPETIMNRLMRFNFTKISSAVIKERLLYICNCEGFTNYTDSCDYISRISQGCMRDAISMLDKVSAYTTDITLENTLTALGNFSYDIMFSLVNSLIDGDEKKVITILNSIDKDGSDLSLFVNKFLAFSLDINKYCLFNSIQMTNIPNTMENEIKKSINFDNPSKYYSYLINKLLSCKNMIKGDSDVKSTVEVNFLSICRYLP